MALCPNGHDSSTDDYCSICGTPMTTSAATGPQPPVAAADPVAEPLATPEEEPTQICPVCRAVSGADAFFCENCGYDFVTGSRPRGVAKPTASPPAEPAAPVADAPVADAAEQPGTEHLPAERAAPTPVVSFDLDEQPHLALRENPLVVEPGPLPGPQVPATMPPPPARLAPTQPQAGPSAAPIASGPARWVAEIWIDPEWYRVQQAPDPLPSPGQPLIRSLRKTTIVIGRSTSSGRPDLDCQSDTGVSRRQAVLTTDGIRWFLEDLGSANGTYIGQVDQPMPTQPISGRVELGHHDRIYLGSWTRIVVRPALVQEAEL